MRYAAALLAFCVLALTSNVRAATEPFTIYAIDAVTGSGAFQGKTMAQAERMVAAIANKAGGINGQPIEMQIVDDQSNPRIAVQLANEIMTHHPHDSDRGALRALERRPAHGVSDRQRRDGSSHGTAARHVLAQPENRSVQVVARERFEDTHRAAGIPITPDEFYGWDSTKIVISALQKLGTAATAEQLRSYIVNLHGFYGISGEYDFRSGDQHGLGDDATVMLQYDPVHQNFNPVSAPGGTPLRNR